MPSATAATEKQSFVRRSPRNRFLVLIQTARWHAREQADEYSATQPI
jgi:hypothetical protein